MTKCPHCDAEVSPSALVCRSCNKRLDSTTLPDRAQLSGRDLLAPSERPDPTIVRVSVVDITMPFGSMVGFMVKWAIAAIPAFIILALILGFLGGLLAGLFRR